MGTRRIYYDWLGELTALCCAALRSIFAFIYLYRLRAQKYTMSYAGVRGCVCVCFCHTDGVGVGWIDSIYTRKNGREERELLLGRCCVSLCALWAVSEAVRASAAAV